MARTLQVTLSCYALHGSASSTLLLPTSTQVLVRRGGSPEEVGEVCGEARTLLEGLVARGGTQAIRAATGHLMLR